MGCENIYDIFMALKTSAILMDMIEDYEEWIDKDCLPDECIITKKESEEFNRIGYYLEVRKWYKMDPTCEYSCYVFESKLLAISQRNLYIINK